MRGFILFQWLSVLSFLLYHNSVNAQESSLEFYRIEGPTIFFKGKISGQPIAPLKTGLFDLHYLGVIKSSKAENSHFIFSAKPCENCPHENAIYALKPGGGKIANFVYPGKIIDVKRGGVMMESRAFFGKCLRSHPGDVYIVFQKERVDRKKRAQSSVFVASPDEAPRATTTSQHVSTLDEKLYERNLPRLNQTLALVRSKVCREIPGRNRNAHKRALDVKFPLSGNDADDTDDADDDDDDKKPH
ncbi:hypothetical protein WDW86_04100 [Bdellovibrionota bacterium FG-2]